MPGETRDRLEPPAYLRTPGARAERPGLPRHPDLARCAQWLQREAGSRWRAGDISLLLWVAPEADLARTHPERCEPVLAETGRLLRQRLRSVDWVVQVGSQAVVAVLFVPDASVQPAVLQRLPRALAAPLVLDGDLVQVAFRTGAASLAGPNADAWPALETARRRSLGA